MKFGFSDDQQQFRDIVARFCRDKSPTTQVRELMANDTGYDPKIWQQLCQELGLCGIHINEEFGGGGFGPVELCIVMEEFGRSLMCAPYFASAVLACTTVATIAHEEQRELLLPGLIDGTQIGTVAIAEADGKFDGKRMKTVATASNNQFNLSGLKRYVVDGHQADVLIVAANYQDQTAFFIVEPNAHGLTRTLVQSMDPTRKLADLTFDNTPARLLGTATPQQLTHLYDTAIVALANEMVGGAQALLDSAVQYTKLRVQFGRTVGSFQAIKHRLADLLLEVELAKSAAYQAAYALAEQSNASETASLAKAAASEAYLDTAIACIQLHGGIGFTWENDTHLWFKRAKSSEVFFDPPASHRERMLQYMLQNTPQQAHQGAST
ncbi:MAG: acyl-CoA/acyl-ACP dehydrogenase [Gammaproteobacteria bacterium]|nr:acyl-CoA/acyl-ACP dehydrogenase [Gammaproteobacteria bacterium]